MIHISRKQYFFLVLIILCFVSGTIGAESSGYTEISNNPFNIQGNHPSFGPQKYSHLSTGIGSNTPPLYFIKNEGQVDGRVYFYAKPRGYTLWLTAEGLLFDILKQSDTGADSRENNHESPVHLLDKPEEKTFTRDVSGLMLLGADTGCEVVSSHVTGYTVHYLKGNNPSEWHTDIPTSTSVIYRNLYNNIDLKIYGNERNIEYDYIIKPGGNPGDIRFHYENVDTVQINGEGDLVISAGFGRLVHRHPRCYQIIKGDITTVSGTFESRGGNSYSIRVTDYDDTRELIVDPGIYIHYSSFLGGSLYDDGARIKVDNSGNMFVAGYTTSPDFPTKNAYPVSFTGNGDAFVSKIDSSGSSLVFSTILGGSQSDRCEDIHVDDSGNIYLTGYTASKDFPTKNAYQETIKTESINDCFITKLSSSGSSLVYSTYLGGSGNDSAYSMHVDSDGIAYITGSTGSTDFPTSNAYQLTKASSALFFDAFLAKLNASGSTLAYATYLGGGGTTGTNVGTAVIVNSTHNPFVAGYTSSDTFPTESAYQATKAGGFYDMFITKFGTAGDALAHSTYLGGSSDDLCTNGIDFDAGEDVYIAGYTFSPDFPTMATIMNYQGSSDAVLFQMSGADLKLKYSTYYGGSGSEITRDLVVFGPPMVEGLVITGSTESTDFPTVSPIQPYKGSGDAFFVDIDSVSGLAVCSTYIGGSESDAGQGAAYGKYMLYITGVTSSADFPTYIPLDGSLDGSADCFVVKLWYETPPPPPTHSPTPTVTATMTPTLSPTLTPTLPPTLSPTYTATASLSFTPAFTPTVTSTFMSTRTPAQTPTIAPTYTGSSFLTYTPTIKHTPPLTVTPAATSTPSGSVTPAPSNTPATTGTPPPSITAAPLEAFDLCKGLNMVSIPYDNPDLDTSSALLADICPGAADVLWIYDCRTKTFNSWSIYDPGTGWTTWTGMPFWVNVNRHCTWNVSGPVNTSLYYELCSGLNMVSLPVYSTSIISAGDMMHDIPYCTAVFMWNKSASCLSPIGFMGYFTLSSPVENFALLHGYGYWVFVTAPETWTPPDP